MGSIICSLYPFVGEIEDKAIVISLSITVVMKCSTRKLSRELLFVTVKKLPFTQSFRTNRSGSILPGFKKFLCPLQWFFFFVYMHLAHLKEKKNYLFIKKARKRSPLSLSCLLKEPLQLRAPSLVMAPLNDC